MPASPAQPPRLAGLGLLALVAGLAPACQTAAKFADQHTFGPMLGPCAAPMDSVERARGKPERKVVGDEEDVGTGHQLFEHEWGYPTADGAAERVHVVRFRWETDSRRCRVDERRARRLQIPLGPPWEEAPDA